MRKLPMEYAVAILCGEKWAVEDPMFTIDEAIAYLEGRFGLQLGNDPAGWKRVVNEYIEKKRREYLALDNDLR